MTVVKPTRQLERKLWAEGFSRVAGVDEVGRGPLAGPVTVAAVILPSRCRVAGLADSKMMSAARRQAAARQIRVVAESIGIGWASSQEIDRLGLTAATKLAGARALQQLGGHELIILDGNHNYFGSEYPVRTCIKADQSCLAVAAASVVAKVARDSYMALIDRLYPEYFFKLNKGYGTVMHRQALAQHGATPYHRRSWRSVHVNG
jgi:ribonuclease HII